jgi:hypothetical protein
LKEKTLSNYLLRQYHKQSCTVGGININNQISLAYLLVYSMEGFRMTLKWKQLLLDEKIRFPWIKRLQPGVYIRLQSFLLIRRYIKSIKI